MKLKVKIRNLSRITVFLLILVIITALNGAVMYSLYRTQYNKNLDLMMESQENQIELELQKISSEIENAIEELLVLEHVIEQSITSDMLPEISSFDTLFRLIGGYSKRFSVMHLISPEGDEFYRLNFDENGKATLVPVQDLQNKKDRYYVERLKEGDRSIYISPLDLNIENGTIEEPRNPALRFGKSIVDKQGHLLAFLVLNYRASLILDALGEHQKLPEETYETYLINSEGFWLKGPDPEKDFAFMQPGRESETVSLQDSDLWLSLQSKDQGTFFLSGNLYVFRVMPLKTLIKPAYGEYVSRKNQEERTFYLVYQTPRSVLLAMSAKILRSLFFPLMVIQIIIVLFSIFLAHSIGRIKDYQGTLLLLSNMDDMTGCLNRRAGEEILEKTLSMGSRRHSPVTIAFLDLNKLKYVNDNIGHKEGDRYILTMVGLIKEQLRNSDYLIRLGGDEFLLILPDCTKDHAWQVRYRILAKEQKLNQVKIYPYTLGMSWGILEVGPGMSISADQALADADALMYEEKSNYPVLDEESLAKFEEGASAVEEGSRESWD